MALHFVRQGMVAVAVDNPATCETGSDLRTGLTSRRVPSGPGATTWGSRVFQKARIWNGLPSKPMWTVAASPCAAIPLGLTRRTRWVCLYPDLVKAMIHNDFCCNWRERTIAQNADPGGLHHVVPGMYGWYDAPDLQASLAPRPLLFTEGGRTPELNRIRAAYRLMSAEENLKVYYYDKIRDARVAPA